MTRTTVTLLCAAALPGCNTVGEHARPRVHQSAAGLAVTAGPVTPSAIEAAARAFMRAYLRAEVGDIRPDDRLLLRQLSTAAVSRDATASPRPTNRGFPPAGVLDRVRLLRPRTPGVWTVSAEVTRGAARERWELQLASSARGPIVAGFQTTAR